MMHEKRNSFVEALQSGCTYLKVEVEGEVGVEIEADVKFKGFYITKQKFSKKF